MKLQTLYIAVAVAYSLSLLLWLLKKKRESQGVLFAAFLFHAVYLGARSHFFGFFNTGGILEEPAFLPFSLAGIAVWLGLLRKKDEAAALVPPTALFALIYLFFPKGLLAPSAKSGSIFVPLFFFFEIAAHALMIAAAVLAFRHLRAEGDFERPHRFAVWGFLLYSVAQVTGGIWCYLGWSVPFQWGLRHLHSATLWCFYANYIHLRFIPWWNNRRKAAYLIAGALILLAFLVLLQSGEMNMTRIGG